MKSTLEITTSNVFDHFAMFTDGGNNAIRRRALRLAEDLEKIHATTYGENRYVPGRGPRSAELRAHKRFWDSYRKFCRTTRRYQEAGDTAVRESVWCQSVKLAEYYGVVDENDLDALWDGEDVLSIVNEG